MQTHEKHEKGNILGGSVNVQNPTKGVGIRRELKK